jgi:hypothetical protein
MKMTVKPGIGFKIWTMILSVFVAVMLFPNIVGRHGVWMSLLITALAVGAIWMMYFILGRVIDWAVSEELKRRELGRPKSKPDDQE